MRFVQKLRNVLGDRCQAATDSNDRPGRVDKKKKRQIKTKRTVDTCDRCRTLLSQRIDMSGRSKSDVRPVFQPFENNDRHLKKLPYCYDHFYFSPARKEGRRCGKIGLRSGSRTARLERGDGWYRRRVCVRIVHSRSEIGPTC